VRLIHELLLLPNSSPKNLSAAKTRANSVVSFPPLYVAVDTSIKNLFIRNAAYGPSERIWHQPNTVLTYSWLLNCMVCSGS
jgi:hypothetical protein